ncbi:MAG: RNA methyltransferase [Bacteroidales bacterium]|nr:RNA methyltransferase [Bacteroidales bacterium]
MISKAQIKQIQSLKQIKFRREYGLFVAEGKKIVEELILSDIHVKEVFGLAEWVEGKQEITGKRNIVVHQVSQKDLERISGLSTPNQALAVCRIPEWHLEHISDTPVQLALDSIRDPGNLGTIIRTADWFGLKEIICSDDCVDAYNPKVVQATMGSIARVKVIYTDLPEYLAGCGKNVFATILDGDSIFDKSPGAGVFVIGNESKGIRQEVLQHATNMVSIPSHGGAESLNASVATGIILAYASQF